MSDTYEDGYTTGYDDGYSMGMDYASDIEQDECDKKIAKLQAVADAALKWRDAPMFLRGDEERALHKALDDLDKPKQ